MRYPVLRLALGTLVVMLGAAYLAVSRNAGPEAVQTGALIYIAVILTVAVITRWL